MKKLGVFAMIGALVSGIVLVAGLAILSGTILFWIWPVAIPAIFPKLVETGWLLPEIAWWPSVCLTWISLILLKSTNTNNCNK